MKLCKDCKHYRPAYEDVTYSPSRGFAGGGTSRTSYTEACNHPAAITIDPVSGVRSKPVDERRLGDCGMSAKNWERP